MDDITDIQISDSWSEAERWVWQEIKAGREADFHKRYNKLDPKEPKGWDDKKNDRVLSPEFIKIILTHETFSKITDSMGVRIIGAYFKEVLNLEYVRVEHQLWFDYCRFLGSLDFNYLEVNGWFSLEGSFIDKNLNLGGTVFSSLNLAFFINGKTNLTESKIEGNVLLDGGTFGDLLDMSTIHIGQNLYMDSQANFKLVRLSDSKIGGHIDTSKSIFNGKLDMSSAEVGQGFYMKDCNFTGEYERSSIEPDTEHVGENKEVTMVELSFTKIGGQVNIGGSNFKGKLDMNSIEVGQDLYMNGCNFTGEYERSSIEPDTEHVGENNEVAMVELSFAKIGGQINMGGSLFKGKLDMHSIEVGQELMMNKRADFQIVQLSDSKIGRSIHMDNSIFKEELDMSSIEVGKDLYMNDSAKFKLVRLSNSKIDGNIEMSDSTFEGGFVENPINDDKKSSKKKKKKP